MIPRAVVFDISGTLWWARQPIPGAQDAVKAVRSLGLAVRCLSNNPRESPPQLAGVLNGLSFDFAEHEVITANWLAAEYVGRNFRGKRVLALGSDVLREELRVRGVGVDGTDAVDAVLAALSVADMNEREVERGIDAIKGGATFLATGLDPWVPADEGRFLPAVGSFARAIWGATGRRPRVLGKPSGWAARRLLASLNLSGRDIVVVGDHVEADVAFGRRMGAATVLVLTGCALPWERQAILASKRPPTVILESVADLPAWLGEMA